MTALLILFVTAIAVLFAGLFEKRNWLQPIGLAGVTSALVVAVFSYINLGDPLIPRIPMMEFGPFATSFSIVVLLATWLLFSLVGFAFRDLQKTLGDQLGLLLFSLCGALCLFSYTNLVMLFLGIEILSIPLYVLAGSRRDNLAGNEAALKYFLMGAFATGILLFGVALVYGSTGSFDLHQIAQKVSAGIDVPAVNA